MIDDRSEPGAWVKALAAPCRSRIVKEYPGEALHTLPSPGTCGAASDNPGAAPVLRSPFHIEG